MARQKKISPTTTHTKQQTVRQRAEAGDRPKTRPVRRAASGVSKPFKTIARTGRREYYLPMPNNRVGRFMNKRRYVIPRYFREAWVELKQVTWPSRRETTKLTLAVFAFAVVFGALIAGIDFGLDKLFKKVLLK